MFDDKHYVPAIKWKAGEIAALEELRSEQRDLITPLVDIPPIPWDFTSEQPARTIDQHLSRVPEQMARAWPSGPIFVDAGLLDSGLRMANGDHPVDDLFQRLAAEGLEPIPVTGTDRDADYQAAVRAVVARDDSGVCIRASIDDLADQLSISVLDEVALDICEDIGMVDLVLDLGAIDPSQAGLMKTIVTTTLPRLPNLMSYRTLTLVLGAFPVNLSSVSPGIALLPRADWATWLSVRSSNLNRMPSFGDYTAAHPQQEEIDPRLMQASASIRYTTDTDWLVARGRSVRSPRFGGFGQYRRLSQLVAAHAMFTGQSFSWASDFIQQCASGGNTGNLTTWRKVATNRHLARVAHQIANLP